MGLFGASSQINFPKVIGKLLRGHVQCFDFFVAKAPLRGRIELD